MDVNLQDVRKVFIVLCASLVFLSVGATVSAQNQRQITTVRDLQLSGTFQSWNTGELTMTDTDGKQQILKIQADPRNFISVDKGSVILNEPAEISVSGRALPSALQAGMIVGVTAEIGGSAKTANVTQIVILPIDTTVTGIEFVDGPPANRQLTAAKIVGRLLEKGPKSITVAVPKHEFASRGQIRFDTEHVDEIRFESDSLQSVHAGDVITELTATQISSGELIVRRIDVELVDVRESFELSVDEQLLLKYWQLSDEPVAPREVRSRNFLIRTDISERDSNILLEKLETMVELISDYYGKSLRQPISCFVIEDLNRWDLSGFDRRVVNKIQEGEGMTVYTRVGRRQNAVVYSANNHGVVQHEAVHAYCYLVAGGTGPLWYAEGMAEMGQYWQPGELAVNMEPAILGYLKSSPPRSMAAIVNQDRLGGEELWKAYAWRWVICHFLASNPNYSRQFKQLGLQLMKPNSQASFEKSFGDVAQEISFEYQHFLKHLKNGFRADLCAWDWSVRSKKLGRRSKSIHKIAAAGGWQPTTLLLEAGATYSVKTDGTWQLEANGPEVSADGNAAGAGRLVAAIFKNYELGEPFELGSQSEFKAPVDGQLCLRCRDNFTLLSDNSGELKVTIQKVQPAGEKK